MPTFRNVTLNCINEFGGLERSREYEDKFVILHDMTMSSLKRIIPLETGMSIYFMVADSYVLDIRRAYDQTNDSEVQDFIQNLALFFATFLGKHVRVYICMFAFLTSRCLSNEAIERIFSTLTVIF